MNFDPDLDVMFSDFAETATITNKQGIQRAALVLLDADYDSESTGGFTTNMRVITATIPSSQAIKAGEIMTINSKQYDVMSVDMGVNGIDKATLRVKP